jgi:transposase
MEVIYERCYGLDVHKGTVVACRITPGADGQPQKEVRTFETMTDDLLALSRWLAEAGVTHVAMESTGPYWKPIWNILEGAFDLTLANPRDIKALSGRKTDRRDAQWIADLFRHGLIKPSFVPDREQRELRELTRYRVSLVQERSAEVNRLQKTLEGANIKLASVLSDVQGVSARQMLAGLVSGRTDTAALAELARGTMRSKIPVLQRALQGSFAPHQRFLIAQQLAHIDALDASIAAVEAEIEDRTHPFADEVQRLDTIPGIGATSARGLIAEFGVDMTKFVDANHFASWGKMCPGMNESAGKRHSSKTGKGNRWLKRLLVEAAHAAGRSKTYLGSQYHRLAARHGKKKAAVAVGHSILVIAYHILSKPGTVYEDLGPNYFDRRDQGRLTRDLVRRLQGLGYYVTLEHAA